MDKKKKIVEREAFPAAQISVGSFLQKLNNLVAGHDVNSRSFAPARVHDPYQRYLTQQPRESWRQLCSAWLRYHAIQLRWDSERVLARLLHRRWIGH